MDKRELLQQIGLGDRMVEELSQPDEESTNPSDDPLGITIGKLYDQLSEEDRKKLFFFMFRTIEFYADPNTWFATALLCDPPCGAIAHDYRLDYEGTHRLGGRARLVYYWILRTLGKPLGEAGKGPFQVPSQF